jgi:MoaA/NifB/PqqE/SkfB family radical SAM enzyme
MAKDFETDVDEAGRLVFPQEIAKQYGLQPGAKVRIGANGNGLHLHRPLTHLSKVYIEPTNRCNLNCVTCIRHSWDEPLDEMSDEIFFNIIEHLQRLPLPLQVFFGGLGEPLSHPNIINMVRAAKKLGATVDLITNGTLLKKTLAMQLIDAGLDMLWLSLDGATPESYRDVRLGAALPEVLANLQDFRYARWAAHSPVSLDQFLQPQLGIVFVAMKRNIEDLPAVMSLASRLGAIRFLVTNVLPYTPEMQDEVLYARTLSEAVYANASVTPSLEMPKMDINSKTREVLFHALRGGHSLNIAGGSLDERNNRCPFIEKGSLSIRWDGEVSPCLALLHDHKTYVHGCERSLKRHSVGNVSNESIENIWRKTEYIAFRKRIQEFDFSPCVICGGCEYFESNQEDCIGSPAPACGGCLWAQGIVQCP